MKSLQLLAIAGLLSLVSPAGCSRGPTLATVTGTVTYKGQPLKEGTITFVPADGRSATGKIVDGKITEVSCFETNDGVPVGSHKVLIQSIQTGADMYAPAKSLIPDKYGSLEKSDLRADIKAGETNTVSFDLK
jgi:hypothetical protein